jgi:hypothetical protein
MANTAYPAPSRRDCAHHGIGDRWFGAKIEDDASCNVDHPIGAAVFVRHRAVAMTLGRSGSQAMRAGGETGNM